MSSFSDISSSGIIEAMQESLSGYSGLERLVSGRTDRLMEGERRRIAILFLDLTGFTELSNAVDHEIVHNLVGCVMGFLSSVVESFGGYVDKFEGDRLMALFGARISAENDSARAVACAMLMLSRLEEVTPLLPGNTAVSARIGINFGSVTVAPDPNGHMTATGVTVNLASRVEEMAIPGKVFVTVNVKDECGDLFEWQDMGETSVRGLKSTVHLFAPIGPGSVQSERWQRAGRLSDLPMVNRIDEIQAIEEAWNMALSDKGTPVLIEIIGEAGIGKSRLVHEFMKRISGAAVLHGHTRPYAQPSFWIWIGLLREYLSIRTNSKEQVLKLIGDFAENSNGSGIRKKIEQVAPVAADLLSLVQSDISRSGSDDSRAKTVALRLLIDAASSRGPVVLVLEDIHWIDEASMKLLKLLLSTHKGLNPLLVVTTRRSAGEVFTDTGVRSVSLTLEPLEKKEIRSISSFLLSDGSIRASLKKDLEKLLLQGAKGNPFYAEEMVLGLLDSGGIILDNDDSWSLTILPDQVQVPPSVQSILQTRIDRLPQHERQLLQVCSVIGPDLRSDVVEAVVSELQLGFNCRDMLENLAGKGYISVSESDKYTFRHDLVQKSAYSTLLKHNRRIIHRLTARSIERLFPEELEALSPILYSHWKSSGDASKTLLWAVKAMLTAFYNARNEESLRLSDTILSMTGTSSDEEQWQATMQALKVKQGVLSRTGHSDRSMEITDKILSRSRERGDPKWEAEGLRARFILLLDASEMDELESIFKLAYEKAGEAGDNALRGKLMGSYANYLSDCARYEEALEYYEKAREIIKEHRIYNILEAILTNIGNLLSRSGELDKAEKYFRESLDINERTGNRIGAGYAMNGYGVCLAQMGDLEQAEELFNEALSCQIDIGDRNLQSSILNNLGFLAKLQGAFDRSMDYRKESLKIARMVGNRRSESIALLNIGNLHRLLGNPLKSIEFCEEASLLSDQTKDPFSKCHAVSIESMSRLDLNDTVNAAALFRLASGLIEEYDWEPGSIDDFDELLEKMSDEGIQFDPPSNW